MFDLIVTPTNVMLLAFAVVIILTFWWPFIRGQKYTAVVDGYEHPQDATDKQLVWCIRFSYKDKEKGGKRLFAYSKRLYDTRPEALAAYKKGDTVDIIVHQGSNNLPTAIILSDGKDQKQALFYSIALVVGCIGLAIGFAFLQGRV